MNRQGYNPLNDYLFKFIFGREERKRITLSFLNAVLNREGEDALMDITFIDREFDPQFADDKQSQLDIYGIASDGSQINIEVQLVNLPLQYAEEDALLLGADVSDPSQGDGVSGSEPVHYHQPIELSAASAGKST